MIEAATDADNVPLVISWFENQGEEKKPALGDPERTTWGAFASVFADRREGEKNGPNFIPARFKPEPDGRCVRRKKDNVIARTAVALDIETSKLTGEVPLGVGEVTARLARLAIAAVVYTSHNHKPGDTRYRIVMPLSVEVDPCLPAPEVMAEALGVLGVLDMSKRGAHSLFFLPSSPHGGLGLHQTVIVPGAPVDAAWMTGRAGALLAARQAEADRVAAEAQAEAAKRREAKIAAGFNPDDSLIEKLRSRFDLDSVLTGHGYAKAGSKYRHPNSQSGSYGADIKVFGGIERVFSHNGTDPLHADNLPGWCDGVTALDAFDVVTILDFGGDRTRAMRELAQRFNLTKAAERKALAGLLFRMIRRQAAQADIEAAAYAKGEQLGLSRDEVCRVARWVAGQVEVAEAA
jgi:hypothetical protein